MRGPGAATERCGAPRHRVKLARLAMKASEVHALDDHELVQRLKEARQEAFNLRFRHATGELENTARLRESRRDLARLYTIARERGIDLTTELS